MLDRGLRGDGMSWSKRTRNGRTDAIDGEFKDRMDKFYQERREARWKRKQENKRKRLELLNANNPVQV